MLAIYVISIALPFSRFLTLIFFFVGAWILIRLAVRIVEILPG